MAGPDALARFGISSGQLGIFVVLQLGVYAAMQIPAGVLVDRFGPRRILLAAALVMAVGQGGFALLPSYPLALVSRGVLGCGDALTYVSVLRLIAQWFPGPRYALISSFSGFFGVLGNVLATVPLAALLPAWGWAPTFGLAAALCLIYAGLLVRPGRVPPPFRADRPSGPLGGRRMLQEVRTAIREPGGRLGFWVHFATMNGGTVFTVLWGFPYLTEALGYSRSLASSILLLMVITQLACSVVLGTLLGRRPSIRVPVALAVAIADALALVAVVSWPGGRPPLGVVVTAVALLALGGPSSVVGFMLARDYNPRHRVSTATGLVNVGGWVASLAGVLLVGLILDLVDPAQRTNAGYRWGFAAVLAITLFGITRVLVWWRLVRGQLLDLQEHGGHGPITVRRHRFDQGSDR